MSLEINFNFLPPPKNYFFLVLCYLYCTCHEWILQLFLTFFNRDNYAFVTFFEYSAAAEAIESTFKKFLVAHFVFVIFKKADH